MRRTVAWLLVAFAASCSRSAPQPAASTTAASHPAKPAPARPAPLVAGWKTTQDVAAPESIYYDQASGFIFSSQIVGMPQIHDGNGRIIKLGGDGKVIDANWVTGLDAPKGLRSFDGTLWTADIDQVVGIGIQDGDIHTRVRINGAKFLNDVAVGPDGTVYVSDMATSTIYTVKERQFAVFAQGDDLEYPNGLVVDGDRLIVGGWGKPNPDFSTDVPGRLYSLDLKTKKKTLITPKPFGNIDGVELDGAGGYLVSENTRGQLVHITASGAATVIRRFNPGLADINYVAAKHILLAPLMNDNMLAAYDLGDALRSR